MRKKNIKFTNSVEISRNSPYFPSHCSQAHSLNKMDKHSLQLLVHLFVIFPLRHSLAEC